MAGPAAVPQSTVMMSLAPSSASPASDRGCAVDVVIAENCDGLARDDGAGEPLGCRLHVLQACRVGQEMTQRRIEKVGKRRCIGAACGKQPPDQLRQTMGLRDGQRRRGA